MVNEMNVKDESVPVTRDKDAYSYYQPVWIFVLLSIITLGAYDIYWYYKNWVYLEKFKNIQLFPFVRTLGLFIPLINLLLIYDANKQYRNLVIEQNIQREIYPKIIVLVIAIALFLSRAPHPFWLFLLIGTITLALVQSVLNDLWKHVQEGYIHKTKLSGAEIYFIIIGGIIWSVLVLGFSTLVIIMSLDGLFYEVYE